LPKGCKAADITRAISKKLFEKINTNSIASLYENDLRIILPGADKDETIRTAEAILSFLNGLAVKTDTGKIALEPVIGLASTTMPGCAEYPLEAARANMEYALAGGDSQIEYSRIRNI
jgi:PleD family two-component response regulator